MELNRFPRDSRTSDVNIEFLVNRSLRVALSKTVFVNSVRYRCFHRKRQRYLQLSSHPRPLPAVSAEHKMRRCERMAARRSGGHQKPCVWTRFVRHQTQYAVHVYGLCENRED